MNRSCQLWTDTELQALRDNYASMPASALAAMLGRSEAAVRRQLQALGIATKFPRRQPPRDEMGRVQGDPTPAEQRAEMNAIRAMHGMGPTDWEPLVEDVA